MNSRYILGLRVDVTSYEDAASQILAWARTSLGRTVCCANVHMVMEGHRDAPFRDAVNGADLVTADGMPLVWALQGAGAGNATRVYGPDLMEAVLAQAARSRIPVGFYGATADTLLLLIERVQRRYPALDIAFRYAPPFRELTADEEEAILQRIAQSAARILFIGIGCPKQERWMARQRHRLSCVQVGVGAAFDQLAGVKPRAPGWMQAAGCEWLFRLAVEPRRLWRRYLFTNTAFLLRVVAGWLHPQQPVVRKAGS